MKLALYQPWIYLHGGLERSILELLTRSRHQWTLYTGHYDPAGTFPGFAQLGVQTLRPTNVNRSIVSVLKSAVQVARQKLPLEPDVDAVVVWCDGIGDLLTFRNHALPIFNVCSTPLRAAFDPSYEAEALKQRSPLHRRFYATFRTAFRVIDRRAWRHYTGVVATSTEVRRRILAGRLCTDDRMILAHPGVDWTPEPPVVSYEHFILVSGRIMWTKNIELAINAFIAADLPSPWKLIIAGYVDKKSARYLAELRALAGNRTNIEFVLSPSDDAMSDLLRRTAFSLFTPLNEDWGIAPLEAMALGKPVIAVNAGGPLESIAHGYSGYLLAPVIADWAAAIARLAGDPALVRRLGMQAHGHVEKFSWASFTAKVDQALADWIAESRGMADTARPGVAARIPAELPGV